ncbi:MAG: hypothetical protein V4726_24615 [Verrucomicrobiota bacterium]
MTDASPEYRHTLIRQRGDSDLFDSFEINLGSRSRPLPDVYREWPSIAGVTDTEIVLHWSSQPKVTTYLISDLGLDKAANSEQGGGGNSAALRASP